MKRRSMILIATLLATSMIVLTACGGQKSSVPTETESKPAQESASKVSEPPPADSTEDTAQNIAKKEITHWNGYTGSDGMILQEMVDTYNNNNSDGVAVKMDIIPWANFHEKLPQAIATGTAPDFVLLGVDQLGNYCSNDSFQSMDDFYDVTGNDKSESSQAVYDLYTYKGKLMYIPMNVFGRYLYWNKTIFEEMGLDPESPPQTWDEALEMAVKCTDPSKNYYGLGVPIKDPILIQHMLLANGSNWLDQATMKSTLTSTEAVEVFTKLQKYVTEYKISPVSTTGPDMDQMLFAGQLAMYVNGPWCINGCVENEIDFGITVVPAGLKGRQGNLDGTGFAIPVSTSDENKALAYKFIAYWNSPAICKEWSIRNGFPPHLKSAIEDPEVKANPILSELSKSLEYVTPQFTGMTTVPKLMDDVVNPAMEQILYGGGDVNSVVSDAAAKMDTILASEK